MKSFNLLLLIFGTCLLFSCSKIDTELESNSPLLQQRSHQLPTITKINGILAFEDSVDVMEAVLYLEEKWEYHNDTFSNNYPELTIDQLDSLDEALSFNEDLPLIQFESLMSFNSLRDSLETETDAWLDNTELVDSTNPDNHHIADPFLQTLLTPFCEIIIDSSIFTLHQDGSYTEVYSLNFDVQDSVKQGIFDPEQSPNGRLEKRDNNSSPPPYDCCKRLFDDKGYEKNYNGNRRIKGLLDLRRFPWTSSIVARTISYKKKSNGKWRRSRSHISAEVSGEAVWDLVTDYSCVGEPDAFHKDSGTKKRKRVVARYHPWKYLFVNHDAVTSVHTGPVLDDVVLKISCY